MIENYKKNVAHRMAQYSKIDKHDCDKNIAFLSQRAQMYYESDLPNPKIMNAILTKNYDM